MHSLLWEMHFLLLFFNVRFKVMWIFISFIYRTSFRIGKLPFVPINSWNDRIAFKFCMYDCFIKNICKGYKCFENSRTTCNNCIFFIVNELFRHRSLYPPVKECFIFWVSLCYWNVVFDFLHLPCVVVNFPRYIRFQCTYAVLQL